MIGELESHHRAYATQCGKELVNAHQRSGISLRFRHAYRSPIQGIQAHLADAGPYELVAVATHGRRRLSRLLLGSVAEATIRYAPCSVLVARE